MLLKIITVVLLVGVANCQKTDNVIRVVNGTDATIGEFPFIVSVRSYNSHTCGGTIIDEYNVMTAAHCVDYQSALSIQYGVIVIDTSTNVITVEKVIIHENYSPFMNYANDIAILRLSEPIPMSEHVQPVNLPTQLQQIISTTPAILAGWGFEMSGGQVQQNLQKVNILAYTNLNCQLAHGINVNILIQMCAGVPEGGKGQCSGDSGGPLIVNRYQAGIVSWSVKPCAIKGYPGVYTKVSSYIDWIKSKIIT